MQEEDLRAAIAQNISFYRRQAGHTQADLAALISYSDKSISKWERGEGVPDIYVLARIAPAEKDPSAAGGTFVAGALLAGGHGGVFRAEAAVPRYAPALDVLHLCAAGLRHSAHGVFLHLERRMAAGAGSEPADLDAGAFGASDSDAAQYSADLCGGGSIAAAVHPMVSAAVEAAQMTAQGGKCGAFWHIIDGFWHIFYLFFIFPMI